MLVRMREAMSGGRHDGRPWPPPDVDFEVPDWEGLDLIRGQLAVPADERGRRAAADLGEMVTAGHPTKLDPRPPAQARVQAEEAAPPGEPSAAPDAAEGRAGETGSEEPDAGAAEPAAGSPAAGPETTQDAGQEPGQDAPRYPVPAGQDEGPEGQPDVIAPGPSAVKQDWIDWAVTQGADPGIASAMTKADLMSRYGGRL